MLQVSRAVLWGKALTLSHTEQIKSICLQSQAHKHPFYNQRYSSVIHAQTNLGSRAQDSTCKAFFSWHLSLPPDLGKSEVPFSLLSFFSNGTFILFDPPSPPLVSPSPGFSYRKTLWRTQALQHYISLCFNRYCFCQLLQRSPDWDRRSQTSTDNKTRIQSVWSQLSGFEAPSGMFGTQRGWGAWEGGRWREGWLFLSWLSM